MDQLEYFLQAIIVVATLLMLYCILIWFPVELFTEAECLRKGYPASQVTIGLERYCMTLDGSVTVNVQHLSREEK